MKNINKLLILIFPLMLVFSSCEESFEELNSNPNEPEKVSLNLLLTSAQGYMFDEFGDGPARYVGAYTQHFAGNHATGVDADQYLFRADQFSIEWDEGFYQTALMDLQQVIEQGTEEESFHYVGVAKIMTAMGLGYLTDVWGDIPYSEAFKGGEIPYPKYDSQESIYTEIQKLLAEGIADLGKSSTASLGGDDMVYGGDVSSWVIAANILSARYHNHLSKIDAQGSATKALAAIDAARAAGLTDFNDDAEFTYSGSSTMLNPWNRLYLNNLTVASKYFMDMLVDNDDPRLEAYWDDERYDASDPSLKSFVGFVGKSNGFGTDNTSYAPVGLDTYFGKPESPVVLITCHEALFIEAEAAFRAGDANRAATALNAAVKESILKYTGAADPVYEGTFASETAGSVTMEKIMNEKYKGMFIQEIESWTDQRRHDFQFPTGIEIPKFADGSPVATEFVRRLITTQSELTNNTSAPKGITQFDRVWWDK